MKSNLHAPPLNTELRTNKKGNMWVAMFPPLIPIPHSSPVIKRAPSVGQVRASMHDSG